MVKLKSFDTVRKGIGSDIYTPLQYSFIAIDKLMIPSGFVYALASEER